MELSDMQARVTELEPVSYTHLILEIFKDRGRMVTLERNSLIGGKKAYRGKVPEYIFTNIPERSTK